MYRVLWMLFRQRDKQLLCGASLLLAPLREEESQHESHNAHFIHSENHNSSLCSLRLTSSQETSTHEFLNRALLSWASPLSSSEACCSFARGTKHLRSSRSMRGSSDVMGHWVSFKQAFWEIWVNGVKMRVRPRATAWKMKSGFISEAL